MKAKPKKRETVRIMAIKRGSISIGTEPCDCSEHRVLTAVAHWLPKGWKWLLVTATK